MKIIEQLKRLRKPNAPWRKFYKIDEKNFKIPNKCMYELIEETSIKYPNLCAINYFNNKITYQSFLKDINRAARAFLSLGIRKGDVVSLCLPNMPEALVSFYALNKIGAIVEMIHPLSSEVEIKNYLNATGSVMLIMVDLCYEKVSHIIHDTKVYKTIIVSMKNSMPFFTSFAYQITKGSQIKKPKRHSLYLPWKEFLILSRNYTKDIKCEVKRDDQAVILHSGGTTGTPKSIVIANYSFNAFSEQARIMLRGVNPGEKVLGILPIFHGFGLGCTIHCSLCCGLEVVLIPKFNFKEFGKLLMKYQPSYVTGVPTLYEGLLECDDKKLDLSFIKYILSGGDSLTISLSRRINDFLKKHGCNNKIAQGYGMSEATAAVSITFDEYANKEGSIGIPLPGNFLKIVYPNTCDEVPPLTDGEICITGPTLMLGYLNNEKETNSVLQMHKDGCIWLHTGDMGYMDQDGVFFYRQRIKRMLITSGYNVYPSQIEEVIEQHEAVLNCTVVGIPHPYKMQVAKAFIVLKNGYSNSIFTKNSIKEHCKKNLSAYAIPYEFVFRKSLPKTLIGKIDFKKLQEDDSNE